MNTDDILKKFEEIAESWTPKRNKVLPYEQHEMITRAIGYSGRQISASKQPRKTDGKDHLAVFNANLIVEGYDKVWFGDIDITLDEKKLKQIATTLQAKVFVLRERDARFENENKPQLQNAVYVTDGVTSDIPNLDYRNVYERSTTGKLLRKQ